MKNETIHIVVATNNSYATHLSVMMTTLLKHLAPQKRVHFYIIEDNISLTAKLKLFETVQFRPATLSYLTVDSSLYEDCLESDHIVQTAYYRISLPDLIDDPEVKRVLYLDCDLLVLDDVSSLYHQDLHGNIVGAVIDPGQAKQLGRLGVASTDYYFNSGVMLIDLEAWRAAQITKKTQNFLENESDKIIYHDQDALNAILYEKWEHLHPKWNLQTSLLFRKHLPPDKHYLTAYEEAITQPSIIHFTGHDKPWNSSVYHPYAELYFKYLEETPFFQHIWQQRKDEIAYE